MASSSLSEVISPVSRQDSPRSSAPFSFDAFFTLPDLAPADLDWLLFDHLRSVAFEDEPDPLDPTVVAIAEDEFWYEREDPSLAARYVVGAGRDRRAFDCLADARAYARIMASPDPSLSDDANGSFGFFPEGGAP